MAPAFDAHHRDIDHPNSIPSISILHPLVPRALSQQAEAKLAALEEQLKAREAQDRASAATAAAELAQVKLKVCACTCFGWIVH